MIRGKDYLKQNLVPFLLLHLPDKTKRIAGNPGGMILFRLEM